jgi:hypothetical protein
MYNRQESRTPNPGALAWELFYEELSTVNSMFDALDLLRKQPLPGCPGREHYSSFNEFIQFQRVPDRASTEELAQYLRIIRKIGPGIGVPCAAMRQIEDRLVRAIGERYAMEAGPPNLQSQPDALASGQRAYQPVNRCAREACGREVRHATPRAPEQAA